MNEVIGAYFRNASRNDWKTQERYTDSWRGAAQERLGQGAQTRVARTLLAGLQPACKLMLRDIDLAHYRSAVLY